MTEILSSGESVVWKPNQAPGIPPAIYIPTNPVELLVLRADLMGNKALGLAGLFHTGLGMREPSTGKLWALDLAALTNLTTAVIPTIDANGAVTIDARCVMEYYPNETREMWEPYWKLNYRSQTVCTISPKEYLGLLNYLFGDFAKKLFNYSLFTIESPSLTTEPRNSQVETSTVTRYTNAMTCDSYVLCSFAFLNDTFGTTIAPFPILGCHISCESPPTKITSRTDPELVDFVQYMQAMAQDMSKRLIPNLSADTQLQAEIVKLFVDVQSKGKDDPAVKGDLDRIKARLIADATAPALAPIMLTSAIHSNARRLDIPFHLLSTASHQAMTFGGPETSVFVYSLDPVTDEANFYKINVNKMSMSASTRYTVLSTSRWLLWIVIGGLLMLICYITYLAFNASARRQ